jgi:hypothetical protein
MANENKMTIIDALKQLRNDIKLWVANNLRVKLDKNLGKEENANKILATDSEGNVITIDQNDVSIDVDSELSTSSENPVQNKVVTEALNEKLKKNLTADDITFSINNDFGYGVNNHLGALKVVNSEAMATALDAEVGDVVVVADITEYADRASFDQDGNKIPKAINNLESDSTENALSAAQGKVLSETIKGLSENIESESNEFNIADEAGHIVTSVGAGGITATKVTSKSLTLMDFNQELVGKPLVLTENGDLVPTVMIQVVTWD